VKKTILILFTLFLTTPSFSQLTSHLDELGGPSGTIFPSQSKADSLKKIVSKSRVNLKATVKSFEDYFNLNGAKGIEGIYKYNSTDPVIIASYTIGIIYEKPYGYYRGYHLEFSFMGKEYPDYIGYTQIRLDETSNNDLYEGKWDFGPLTPISANPGASNLQSQERLIQNAKNEGAIYISEWLGYAVFENIWQSKFENTILQVVPGNNRLSKYNASLIKIFPKKKKKKKSVPKKPKAKKNEWLGNGSGIIISKEGHIVTSHHVIKDKDSIEVEFKNDLGINKYKAKVINLDESNDLAIIQITDKKFEGFEETPNYNFDTEIAEVGTKVYAYGYPMAVGALSIMGKEIKITDGIINSKTGFKDDIKTYQISAPIQGGNSGGPLFDDNGSLVGINSSGLSKEIVDNVGYSIKSNYISNLISALPQKIELPYSYTIKWISIEKQIKRLSKYVVLIKVK